MRTKDYLAHKKRLRAYRRAVHALDPLWELYERKNSNLWGGLTLDDQRKCYDAATALRYALMHMVMGLGNEYEFLLRLDDTNRHHFIRAMYEKSLKYRAMYEKSLKYLDSLPKKLPKGSFGAVKHTVSEIEVNEVMLLFQK
jgi:hypothetical protein